MPLAFRFLLFAGPLALLPPTSLQASLCIFHEWTLNEIADVPILVAGRIVSLEMENGPRFSGEPKRSAPPQQMTAEVEVLRFTRRTVFAGAPPRRLKIRFTGRDGPDFSFCAPELPALEPGQMLLLPLRGNPKPSSEPWQLLGAEGHGMTPRIAKNMGEPATQPGDSRSFIIRELVNSFRRGDPLAVFTAASLIATQARYLEPELTTRLQRAMGNNAIRWTQLLAGILLSHPGRSLTLAEARAGRAEPDWPRFQGFPLAQLALSHLPSTAIGETLVWQSVLAGVPSFADEPYHPLFSYNPSLALQAAQGYLSHYRGDPGFIQAVKAALRHDRPGSSSLAAILIDAGETACLPEALVRAEKVIHRPMANGDDVFAAIRLLLNYGTDRQRRQLAALAVAFKGTNPSYAAFLQLKLDQSLTSRL